ncbi:hypothetical protein D3C78_1199300 [compost metagenome]
MDPFDFNRISELRPCPVRFDIGDGFRINSSIHPCLGNHFFLRGYIRSGNTDGAAILIDSRAFNDRIDRISIRYRPSKRLKKNCGCPLAHSRPVRFVVERFRSAVRRLDAYPQPRICREDQRLNASCQSRVAVSGAQRLAGEMNRDERRRTGRIYCDGGSF